MNEKWNLRFLALAQHISAWSRDPSTQCGAVIVRDDKRVVSMGFNGFPAGMPDDPALYEDRSEKYSRVLHAEVNALLFADRELVKGATLYTWPLACCDRCAVQAIQSGIRTFVFPKLPEELTSRWGASVAKTKQFYNEVGATWLEI